MKNTASRPDQQKKQAKDVPWPDHAIDHVMNKMFPFMVRARAYADIVIAREEAGEKKEDIWADLEKKGITI